jgi:hypothetical protein
MAARFIEPEIKPRVTSFQGFSDFEQETTQFLGKRPAPSFEDEFADFGVPHRNPLGATAGEVMAGIASDAKAHPARTPAPPPPPELVHEEEPIHTETKSKEDDDKDQFKKRRRRGKGKERSGSDENGGTEATVEATKIDDRPISFDDVPFMAPEPPKVAQPVFHDWTPERPKPAPQQHHHVEKEPSRQEEAAPVAAKPPVRDFGFGIFDE